MKQTRLGRACVAAGMLAALGACASIVPERYPPHQLVRVEPGRFRMGSDDGPAGEQPAHWVTISRPYLIAVHEVTFDQFDAYSQATKTRRIFPTIEERGSRPVIGVNWLQAVQYCNWLSQSEGLDPCYEIKGRATTCDFEANGYRLPTEAEWEYAARGGHLGKGFLFSGSDNVDVVAWYADTSGGSYHEVGLKQPNELGVYDMSGNAWEWCWDFWDPDYYAVAPPRDPRGPESFTAEGVVYDVEKVRRSFSQKNSTDSMRVTARSHDGLRYHGDNGLRVVRTTRAD